MDNVKDKNENKEVENVKNKDEAKKQPVFNAKVKSDVIKALIDVTHSLVEEAKFNITPKGISLRAYDPAHVAMVDINIKDTAFEEYKAEEMELGIDIDKLSGILKLAGSDDIISLKYDDRKNRLIIKIGNLVRRMGLIDTAGMSDLKMPTLDLPAIAVVRAGDLSRGIRASEMISDHLALTVDKDKLELYAEGDTDTVNLSLSKDMLIEIDSPDKYKSLFSIDYLNKMIKVVKSKDPVTLHLGNDNPMKVDFDFADGKGHVTYLFAPRVESE